MQWRDYAQVARGYEPRAGPIRHITELKVEGADDEGDDAEEGEGDGRAKLVDKAPDGEPKRTDRGERTDQSGKAGANRSWARW